MAAPLASSKSLASLSFAALLDAVAARTPAPGSGAVSALAVALAAGLTEMAARFAPGEEAAAARAAELRAEAAPLADEDAAAYERYLRDRELDPIVEAPLRVAALAAETAELAANLALAGNPNLRGDAATGAALAAAAAASSALLVRINLEASPGDERVERAAELAAAAEAAALRALA
ncbi:MAG: cyclodeaminase/cyclohydrolase family protein [Actinobacteria bacterium]|nr:cyclodeaminase/cyclohydrolase family protein [Actinomycetota bacterium]